MRKNLCLLLACLTTPMMLLGHTEKPAKTLYYTNDEMISVTPPAGPVTSRSWNPYITADFIYWTVREDGLFHAVSGVGANVGKGTVYDIDFEWDPGFKVGLGFNLPHDGWSLFAKYTWIHSNVSNTVSQDPTTSNLVSYWSINGSPLQSISRSRATWEIHFHDVHLELGRNCYLSQYLKARIHAGLRGAFIYQDYEVSETLVSNDSINRLSQDQDFWGVGLRAGMDTSWQFTHNWSFFADFDLSILWGQFDLDRKDRNILTSGVGTTNIHTGVSPHTFEPVLGIDAGFRWEEWFCDGAYHFLLQAGWEHQLWILQNEFIKVPTETDHIGDLVLQGLTIKARFDF